jgi:hypothetical protein
MLQALQRVIISLSERSQVMERTTLVRKAVALAWRLVRSREGFAQGLAGLQATGERHEIECASWVSPETMLRQGGPFDACDLRHWLALAAHAGVPAIPARTVLLLDDAEMNVASGQIAIPDNAVTRRIRQRAQAYAADLLADAAIEAAPDREACVDPETLDERLHAAMDDVPEGWMVRYARCGGSNLKALAGFGAIGHAVPEVRFGPNLEVGPGWIRRGNRRKIVVSDTRTVESAAQGPGGPHAFLARPWVAAARYAVGEDPHRHGTQFAGKGSWPAEWRAFVENGQVVGVASYYGWCGSVSPENARVALAVRALAQKIADAAVALKAYPRFADIELLRSSGHPGVENEPLIRDGLALFGRETVACTLDFIEVAGRGPMLLEGGPGNSPFGGGHPCAFAGVGGLPKTGNKTITQGVAFRLMPHVTLADVTTWIDGDHAGSILDWPAVEALAAEDPDTGIPGGPSPQARDVPAPNPVELV